MAEGVLSDIDFFLENSTSLGEQIQVIVQHQQGPHMAFNRKCQIIHRNEWPLDCQTQDPCLCGNFTSGTFEYKLRMVFSQADSGRWQFAIFNGTSVYITIRVMGELLWISDYLSDRAYLFKYFFTRFCIVFSISVSRSLSPVCPSPSSYFFYVICPKPF